MKSRKQKPENMTGISFGVKTRLKDFWVPLFVPVSHRPYYSRKMMNKSDAQHNCQKLYSLHFSGNLND